MAVIATVQAAHSYGVLDPHAIERRDTKFVPASLSAGENIVLLPTGGYTDRGGSDDHGAARRALAAEAITAPMLTLPNGGAAADLLAGNTQTTSAAAGSRFVLFEIDFGAAKTLAFIDIGAVSIATTPAAGALIAEWHDGADWQPFGAALDLFLSAQTRRFAAGAPGESETAQRFRVAVDATSAAGAVSFSAVAAWRETAALSAGRVRCFTPAQGEHLQIVFTGGNADIYHAGAWQASAPVPATEAMLPDLKPEAKGDTILLFHADLETQRLFRLGDKTQWSCAPAPFENVPLVDYGEVYTNGVTEVQEIQLYDLAAGEQFDLTLEGQQTTAITKQALGDDTATEIKNALEALSNVDAGLTVAKATSTAVNTFIITFTGGGNEDRDWLQIVGTALDSNGYVKTRTLTKGKAGGEPIISAARGWPAVGRFAQQRLVMAGMKSRPGEYIASVTGDPFNLDTELDVSIAAMSYEVDAPGNNAVRDIIISRTLIFLGSEAVTFLKSNTMSADQAPQWGASDAPGMKSAGGVLSTDNAILYVQEGGRTLRQISYSELEQNYVADNASVLSAFLIRDPADMARRRATGAVDSDLLLMANDDGTAVALTMMRTQEVSGFAPWRTAGAYRSFAVDGANTLWQLVERDHDGTPSLRLEKAQPALLLDEAETRTAETPITALTGLDRFDGREIWAIANDAVQGPFVPASGAVTLEFPASGDIRVGTWIAPSATDPDLSLTEETRRRQPRLQRVFRARVSVVETTSLALAVNGADALDLPLWRNDEIMPGVGPLARPKTGEIEAEGMHGFAAGGRATVTQRHPGKLTVRAVKKDVVT